MKKIYEELVLAFKDVVLDSADVYFSNLLSKNEVIVETHIESNSDNIPFLIITRLKRLENGFVEVLFKAEFMREGVVEIDSKIMILMDAVHLLKELFYYKWNISNDKVMIMIDKWNLGFCYFTSELK